MTDPTSAPATGPITTPDALLLDFGGVIVGTRRRPSWTVELAAEVLRRLERAGFTGLGLADITADLVAGAAADSHWKNAMSRPYAPEELTHARFWCDFVAADWPEHAREVVRVEATPLCKFMGELRHERRLRPGIEDLFAAADERGIRIAVVSNALCGAVHRDFLDSVGLAHRVAAQIYSDEVGIRKPNPGMIALACRALALPADRTWYVGDNFDRDVVCGRRAGVGATILMEAAGTYDRPYEVRDTPQAVVADPKELLRLLTAADPR
jgi:N-acetyl-D-muramate 6-phosphate phosphatase